MMIFDLIWR